MAELFKPKQVKAEAPVAQIGRGRAMGETLADYMPLGGSDNRLYESMRDAIPVIDAALDKIVRLTGGFRIVCEDKEAKNALESFLEEIPTGGGQHGIYSFLQGYLNSLLTYGNAVGEIVLDRDCSTVAAVYNAPMENVQVRQGENPLTAEFFALSEGGGFMPVQYPELLIFSALRPKPGEVRGRSILAGLPFVADVLMKIYSSIGNNFDRIANLRYAVTYKPTAGEQNSSKEIAESIAKEWGSAMENSKNGSISDFVAVGDVDIKVIGADNQMIDTEVPARQLVEQIVAKLGIPPFLLGLHWSATERMSKLQTDILTSEMEYYRGLLTAALKKICTMEMRLRGLVSPFDIDWDIINLQDETEMAEARYTNAQAEMLEREMGVE